MKKENYTLTSVDKVKQICAEYLRKYPEIKHLIFTRSFSNGTRAVLTTNAARIEDSHVLKPKSDVYRLTEIDIPEYLFFSHFVNTDLSKFKKIYEIELKIQREKFKISEELIYFKKLSGYSDHFSFATNLPSDKAIAFFLNHLEKIKIFSQYFYWAADTVIKKAVQNPLVDLPKNPPHFLIKGVMNSPSIFSLSRQELKICQLITEGYSAKEIGKRIILSNRTVEHYLENIKNKLNVKKKSDLISILIKFNLPIAIDFLK